MIIEMTLDKNDRVQFNDVTNLEQANLIESFDEAPDKPKEDIPQMLFGTPFTKQIKDYHVAKSSDGPILAVMIHNDVWDLLISNKENLYKREEELYESTKSQSENPNASLFSMIKKRLHM